MGLIEFLARTVYFILFGWWIGMLWYVIAYIFCITIIGLPIGLLMLNRLPQILTLKPIERMKTIWIPINQRFRTPQYTQALVPKEEFPFILRIVYFFLAGWWIATVMGEIAFILCLTIIGMPLGVYIFNRFPLLLTLKQVY